MRSFTYGSSDAGKVLDILVTDDRMASKRVSAIYNSFTIGLKEIDLIKNESVKLLVEQLWVEQHKKSVQISKLTDKTKNYLNNVIIGRYRDILAQRRLIVNQVRERIKNEKRKARAERKKQNSTNSLNDNNVWTSSII